MDRCCRRFDWRADPGGSVALETASPPSPPNALRATVADDSGIGLSAAHLSRRTETDAGSRCASLRFKASLRTCDSLVCFLALLASTTTTTSTSVGLVVLNTSSGGVGLATTDSSGSPRCAALVCDFLPAKDIDGNKLRLNATDWYDVVLEVDARIDPPTARLEVRAAGKVWSAELSTPEVATVVDRLSIATIGLPGVDSPGSAEAWFDDLQVGLQAR